MSFLFQALGVAFVLLIVAIVIAFLWIRSKIRAFLKAAAAGLTPPRIHCMRVLDHAWSNGRSVAKLVDPLLAVGFEDAGVFKIDELPHKKLGEVSEPVGADAYVAPESARRASRS